jgi:hypothetical protein
MRSGRRPAANLALPYVYRSYSGYTSSIRLLNTNAQAANVYLLYYDRNGNYVNPRPGALQQPVHAECWSVQPNTGSGFYGSVAIQSNQPLAVLSDAYNTAIDISTQAGVGATSAYLPYIMRNYGGWNSCFVVRNLSVSANSVTITYYHSGGTTVESQSIAGNAMWTRCQQSIGGMPDGPLAAWITSNSGLSFVLAINQSQVSAGKHMSYNGSQPGEPSGQPAGAAAQPLGEWPHLEQRLPGAECGRRLHVLHRQLLHPSRGEHRRAEQRLSQPGLCAGLLPAQRHRDRHDGRPVVGAGDGGPAAGGGGQRHLHHAYNGC